jgi:hypothetical protein
MIPTLLLLFIAGQALAGPPVTGSYVSSDLPGGTFYIGHFSESWTAPTFYAGNPGNTINAESWDGAALGGEWTLHCAAISAPPTFVDNRIGPPGSETGTIVYTTDYTGGSLWLGAAGPWGDEDYDVNVDQFTVVSTHLYVNGVLQPNIVSDVTIFGSFTNYINCMTYTIANAAIYGNTIQVGPLPADYPGFTDAACVPGPQTGAWGNTEEITLVIYPTCEVGVEETSWGSVKARY